MKYEEKAHSGKAVLHPGPERHTRSRPPGRERKCERLSPAGLVLRSQADPKGISFSSLLQKKSRRRGKRAKGKQDRELEGMPVGAW